MTNTPPFCPQCGAPFVPGHRFCPMCSMPLIPDTPAASPVSAPATEPATPEKGERKKLGFIRLLFAILVLLIIAVPFTPNDLEFTSENFMFSLYDLFHGEHTPYGVFFPLAGLAVTAFFVWNIVGFIQDLRQSKRARKGSVSLLCTFLSGFLALAMMGLFVGETWAGFHHYSKRVGITGLYKMDISRDEADSILAELGELGLYESWNSYYGWDKNCSFDLYFSGTSEDMYISWASADHLNGTTPFHLEVTNGHIENMYSCNSGIELVKDGQPLDNVWGRILLASSYNDNDDIIPYYSECYSYTGDVNDQLKALFSTDSISYEWNDDKSVIDSDAGTITMYGTVTVNNWSVHDFSVTLTTYTDEELERICCSYGYSKVLSVGHEAFHSPTHVAVKLLN